MSKYSSVLAGAEFSNSSLAEGGYDYYLFTRPGGSGAILRINTAGNEAKFHLFGGAATKNARVTNITSQWAARVGQNYLVLGAFKLR